jgi:hypothetical protein
MVGLNVWLHSIHRAESPLCQTCHRREDIPHFIFFCSRFTHHPSDILQTKKESAIHYYVTSTPLIACPHTMTPPHLNLTLNIPSSHFNTTAPSHQLYFHLTASTLIDFIIIVPDERGRVSHPARAEKPP